jgi:pantetheine-phosphate adenylyltransferase
MQHRTAIFPGSFDPFTKGHEDIVRRGLKLFDRIIIAIGINSNKTRYFELPYMKERIEETFKGDDRIEIDSFVGLTGEFARSKGTQFLLRGLRNTTDFEYENTIAKANGHVFPGLETVFMITDPSLANISSSIVRDLHKYGADVRVFLPYDIAPKNVLNQYT